MLTAQSPPGHILMYAPRRALLVAYMHPELFRVYILIHYSYSLFIIHYSFKLQVPVTEYQPEPVCYYTSDINCR